MKKILYLVTQAETGGAQKYVFDLATNLDKDQFEVVVASGGKKTDPLPLKLQEKQIKYHCLKNLKREINPIADIFGFFKILKLIKKEKPDIIHLNSSKAEVLGAVAADLAGVKRIIFTSHGYVFNEPMSKLKKKFYIILEKFSSRFIHKIICVSEFDKQQGLKHKIAPENKYTTIHNAINLNDYNFLEKEGARQKSEKKTGINFEDKKIISTIANLYKTKGLEYFIEAASILNNKNLIFLIIGEGDERRALELRINKIGLKNFFLVGNIPQAANYLKAFNIFVLPSVKEGFPYTILEAQAAGIPIITTRVGALPEIIRDNENGVFVEPKNPLQLAEKIQMLINNQELYQKIKNNTKYNNQKFQNFLDKTKEVYS